MRQVNTRFFFILLGTVIFLTAGLFGVHRLQAGNIANALLWQASQAENNGKAALAARYLGQYLEFVPDDINERVHLATILSDEKVAISPATRRRAEYVINQVLAWDPQQHALRLALCRLALRSQRLDVIEEQLKVLNAKLPESGAVALLEGQYKELLLETHAATLKSEEREKRLREIRSDYEQAIRREPGNAQAYLRLVVLLRRQDFGSNEAKNGAEIDRLVSAALKTLPEDAVVLSLAAQRAQEKGDTEAARKYLDAGLKKNAYEPRLFLALARLDGQTGNRADAIARLKKGLDVVGKDQQFDLNWMLANLLLDDEQIDPARKVIAQVREVNPLSAEYLEARCMMYQGRWYDAARTFEKLRPTFRSVAELAVQVDLFLGSCYRHVNEPLLQLRAFQRAAKGDPGSLMARHGELTALAAMGRRDEAIELFRGLIESNGNSAEVNQWRLEYAKMLLEGSVGIEPQLATKLHAIVEEAEKDSAQAVECALLRAALLYAQKKAEEAQVELHRIIKAQPRRFEPWLTLAALAMEAQQPEKADTILEQAGAIVEDSVDFRVARLRFLMRYRKDQIEPLEALIKDLDRFPAKEQGGLLEAVAGAHYRAGRPTQAVRLLQQVAALPPHREDVRIRMLLLSLALAQDDDAAAQRVLEQVKKIEGEPASEWSYGEALRLMVQARQSPPNRKQLLDQARGLLNVTATRRSEWPALFVARGELDELEGKLEPAIASYRHAIDLGSRDPYAVYQLMQLYTQTHRFDDVELLTRKMEQAGVGRDIGPAVVLDMLNKGRDVPMALNLVPKLFSKESKNYRDWVIKGQMLSIGARSSAEAETALRTAVALAPQRPEVWVALVRYLGSVGQFAQALEEIGRAGGKLGDDVRLLTQASCYEVIGAFNEADMMYRTLLTQQPKSARLHRQAADFMVRAGKPRDAEALYRLVLDGKLGPAEDEVPLARRGLALALARGANPQRVAEALQLVGLALDAAGNLDPASVAANAETRLLQARVLSALPSHALRGQAIKLFEAFHQKQALAIDDQIQLAQLLHMDRPASQAWKRSREILAAVTASQPHHARYLGLYANLLLVHQEVPEAETLIARLEQLEGDRKLPPGTLGSIELKARALELRGKEAEAIALLAAYADQKDAPRVRLLLLASLHGRLGNYQEAVDLCYQVKQANYREAAYAAAVNLLRLAKPPADAATALERWREQLARIEASLKESIQLDDGNVMLRLQLADLLELQERYEPCEAVYREVLKKEADNVVALNNLAWTLAHREGKGKEALTMIARAIERYAPRPELLDTRAMVYLSLNMPKEAVRDLELAVRDAPTPTRYFHLTRAHHLAKNAPLALAALQRANDLGLSVPQLHPTDQQAYERVVPELRGAGGSKE
jgi:predicted Zn-dependent protease